MLTSTSFRKQSVEHVTTELFVNLSCTPLISGRSSRHFTQINPIGLRETIQRGNEWMQCVLVTCKQNDECRYYTEEKMVGRGVNLSERQARCEFEKAF